MQPHYLNLVTTIRMAASSELYEVQTSSMVTRGDAKSIEIQNPIGDNKFIRQSILPELFALTKQYVREGYDEYGCFEITNTYRKNDTSVEEKVRFAACMAKEPEIAKSIIGLILHRLHIDPTMLIFEPCDQSEDRAIKYDSVAHIILRKTKIGSMCVEQHKGKTLCGFKLYIEELAKASNSNPTVTEYSKYPSTKRDIALVIDRSVNLGDIAQLLKNADPLITSAELFDQFTGKGMADTMRSLAFHLNFQSQDRTLTTQEVDAIMKKIEQQLQTKFKAEIR